MPFVQQPNSKGLMVLNVDHIVRFWDVAPEGGDPRVAVLMTETVTEEQFMPERQDDGRFVEAHVHYKQRLLYWRGTAYDLEEAIVEARAEEAYRMDQIKLDLERRRRMTKNLRFAQTATRGDVHDPA